MANRHYFRRFLKSTACFATLMATANAAHAENATAGADTKLGEIIVTAERRATSIQSTPLSVTAVSGATIARKGLVDILDVAALTPSLDIGGDSELGIVPIVIRGIGTTDPEGTTQDSPVAVYADGVYLSRPFADVFALPDVDRVEVLRGPQGTLFGRNSSAGAIQVITKQPNGVFDAAGDVSYGSYNATTARGYVLIPVDDHWGVKLAAVATSRDGWAFSPSKDTTYGGESSDVIRGSIRYKTDDRDIILQADHSYAFSRSQFVNPVLEPTQPINVNTTNSPGGESRDSTDVSLSFKQRFAFADLDVIGAYVQDADKENLDADSTQIDLVSLRNIDQSGQQYSLEARLTSNNSTTFHWMTGVFLFGEDDLLTGDVVLGSAITGGAERPASELDNNSHTRSASFFTEGSYDITSKLEITLGGRVTDDQKTFVGRNLLFADPVLVDDTRNWAAFTPRAIVKYSFSHDLMAYLSASRGFRSGTWSVTASSPIPAKPEYVWNYEAGLKSTFLDGRARVDLSAFHEVYSNKQEEILIAPGVTAVRNAASATIDGVEAEYQFKVVPRLILSGSFSYLDARYGTYVGSPSDVSAGVSDVYTGHELPFAPKISSTVDLAYDISLPSGQHLILDGAWEYKSRDYFSRQNIDIESSDPFSDFNFNVSWVYDRHLTTTLYAKNAFDERHPVQVLDFLNEGFGAPAQYNLPAQFGIRVQYHY
jgi:iron complex outermembrane receptor protein